MSKTKYDAICIAKQLYYKEEMILQIQNAKSEAEITRILHDAREAM